MGTEELQGDLPLYEHDLIFHHKQLHIHYYRQSCVATQPIMFCYGLFFLFFLNFFIHRSFSETTQPILTKFSGIVYSGVV